nr:DUF4279 domain-containing protein [Planococcus glaciei]
MEKTQVMVYFSLTADDFPLEAVSKRMGIEPTKSHRKGDLIRKISEAKTHSRSYSSWELCTGYQESLDAGEQIDQVIRQLKDKEKGNQWIEIGIRISMPVYDRLRHE